MTVLEPARPWGLLALLLPLLLLWLARVAARPPERVTGTLALWRAVSGEAAQHGRSRPRIPLRTWLLALALFVGAVALAGPRRRAPERVRTWTLVVDASPSMHLELAPGETRLERALAAAAAWLAAQRVPGDELRWVTPTRDGGGERSLEAGASGAALALPPGLMPPAPELRAPEPRWPRYDRPGWLWITDRAPEPGLAHAGVFASGGEARPGPVSTRGSDRVDWDGERLVVVPGGAPTRAVEVAALPDVLVEMVRAWAAERGLELRVGPAGGTPPALVVSGPRDVHGDPGGGALPAVGARDGWRLAGAARPLAGAARPADGATEPDPAATWLAGADGAPLVRFRPGLVESAWTRVEPPAGDPAAFAVSWAELLDRAVLPAAGTVPLAERLAAGVPAARAGEPPPSRAREASDGRSRSARPGAELDAWLALAAGLIALAGLVYSAGSEPSSPTDP